MPFVKGKSGNAAGRPVGAISAQTKSAKQAVEEVFSILQDDDNHSLLAFARKFPRDYYAIWAKLLPLSVKSEITVPEGIKVIFQNDPNSKPIGTDPEDYLGIPGE